MFLISVSRNTQLVDDTGEIFDPAIDGLMSGPIGREYLQELGGNRAGLIDE
jgi:hypothetical protein